MTSSELKQRRYLVADVGGTNTRVAIAHGRSVLANSIKRYKNVEVPSLEDVLCEYITEYGDVDFDGCCIAAAGPRQSDIIKMSNIGWTIDPKKLTKATGINRVELLNDLQALGFSVDQLAPNTLLPIIARKNLEQSGAVQLVVGVGTGFNAAVIHICATNGKLVTSSECGHARLAVNDESDLLLSKYCSHSPGFTSVEDMLSGRGLETIYAWLGEECGRQEKKSAAEICAALDGETDSRAIEAARIFAKVLGEVVGDLALIHLPMGGIFLAGGVIRSLAPYLVRFGFVEAFRNKGRFEEHMLSYEVFFIDNDFAALFGCASFLSQEHRAPNISE